MDKVQVSNRRVPIITRTKPHGDIFQKSPTVDRNVNPSEAAFIRRNIELQGDIGGAPNGGNQTNGQAGNQTYDNNIARKSELVEIPTPTSRIIYRVNSLFPFDLFPDSLVIDELKVSFIYAGFLTKEVITVLIKDITDILVNANIFFGSILVSGGDYQGNAPSADEKGPLVIKFLNTKEAYKARRIIMGLMIYQDQKVDTSQMSIPELIEKTEELGQSQEV